MSKHIDCATLPWSLLYVVSKKFAHKRIFYGHLRRNHVAEMGKELFEIKIFVRNFYFKSFFAHLCHVVSFAEINKFIS